MHIYTHTHKQNKLCVIKSYYTYIVWEIVGIINFLKFYQFHMALCVYGCLCKHTHTETHEVSILNGNIWFWLVCLFVLCWWYYIKCKQKSTDDYSHCLIYTYSYIYLHTHTYIYGHSLILIPQNKQIMDNEQTMSRYLWQKVVDVWFKYAILWYFGNWENIP